MIYCDIWTKAHHVCYKILYLLKRNVVVKIKESFKYIFFPQNIQSTNWQSMRFKVPPINSNIGWRVEFRPCEVQLTDFENAAFGVFIVLLTRAILTFKLNMLIPISKVSCTKVHQVYTLKFWKVWNLSFPSIYLYPTLVPKISRYQWPQQMTTYLCSCMVLILYLLILSVIPHQFIN